MGSIVWKRIGYYFKPYYKKIVVILLCILGLSFLSFLQPILLKEITDKGMLNANMELLLQYGVLFLFSGFCVGVIEIFKNKIYINLYNSIYNKLHEQIFEKLCRLPLSYYQDKNTTEILHMVSTDIAQITSLCNKFTDYTLMSFTQICVGVLGILFLDKKLLLLIVLGVIIKYFIIEYYARTKGIIMKKYIENTRKFHAWFGEQISGIREIKLWCLSTYKINILFDCLCKVNASFKSNSRCDQLQYSLENFVTHIINAALYVMGGLLFINDELTIGSVFAYVTYSNMIVTPLELIINLRYMFEEIKPSAERLFLFLDLKEENLYGNGTVNKEKTDNEFIIEFKGVSYQYTSQNKIFSNLDLKIKKGEHIGIIGNNGCGKSTLLDLMVGFIEPDNGIISLYGKKIEDLGYNFVRSHIAYVSQKPFLFQNSVEQNIGLKNDFESFPMGKAQDEWMKSIEYLFSRERENGLGDNGTKISGGEKQKIAMAMALLKDTDILLLDEIDAGCDRESLIRLENLINDDFTNKTIIMVSHRKEILKKMDRIYEIRKGKLVKV